MREFQRFDWPGRPECARPFQLPMLRTKTTTTTEMTANLLLLVAAASGGQIYEAPRRLPQRLPQLQPRRLPQLNNNSPEQCIWIGGNRRI